MHICRYYHQDDVLAAELRQELEDAVFESFHSDDPGVPAATEEPHPDHASPGTTNSPPAASPVRRTLDRLTRTLTFTRYTRGNARLSERLAHEAVHWVSERWAEIEESDPFEAEEAVLRGLADADPPPPPDRVADSLVRHRPELTREARLAEHTSAPTESPDRGTQPDRGTEPDRGAQPDRGTPPDRGTQPDRGAQPGRGAARARRDHAGWSPERVRLDREARTALLCRRWRERLDHDRANHRARILGRALGSFARELEELVPQLAREQELVRDALGNEDALWDLTRHEWEELPLSGLAEGSRTLAEHPEIARLAEALGRSRAVTERRTSMETERHVRLRPIGIGKSEVTGIRAGDDLTSLIASEVALLAYPETADLFYAKLARQELLVLDYSRQRLVEDVTLRRVAVSREVPVERGPAIICVDTSGSMLGLPERIAKAAVLAVARRLETDRRRVEVIAFSSQVRSFGLDYRERNLPELARFLEGSFHGGTDLSKALRTALEKLREEELSNADVLVISDFRVPKIADRYLEQINRQHRRGTLFHSLTVARKPVVDPLHIFDSSWLFSTESGRMAPESLRPVP